MNKINHIFQMANLFYKLAMIVENIGSGTGLQSVVAYKSKIWLMDYVVLYNNKPIKELSKKERKIFKEINEELGHSLTQSFGDLTGYIRDTWENVLLGYVDTNKKILYVDSPLGFKFSPQSSILVNKVVNQLNLKKVQVSTLMSEEGETKEFKKQQLKGELPKILYHGTSTNYAYNILKFGLRPGVSPSNYPRLITHPEDVFLTTHLDLAAYHANHTSERASGSNIIFGFEIPDKSLLIPDYDVQIKAEKELGVKPESLSREFGIVGYHGRIPASFIREVWIQDKNYYPKWTKISMKKLIRLLNFI